MRQRHDLGCALMALVGKSQTYRASVPASSAPITAATSTMPAREKFTTVPPGRMRRSRAALTSFRVPSTSGTCTVTMSARANRSSSDSVRSTPDDSCSARWTVRSGSKPTTRMPRSCAAFATSTPIAPSPITPSTVPAVRADELLLALLHREFQRVVITPQAAHVRARLADVAGREQQGGDDQLLDRIGIRPGRVEHRDAAFRHRGHRHVVGPRPGTARRPSRSRESPRRACPPNAA